MTTQTKSLSSKVIRGSFWTVGMRWGARFMGIASMSIIARLLTPEDFGIVAVAISIIGLMDAFTDMGVETALIRHTNPSRKHYNTAWTFNVLMHWFSAGLVALAGYFSASFYNDPRYEGVLYVMSLSMICNGLSNIGIADFRRNLDYHKDFQINVFIQIIGVVTTISLAFLLHSYWALVLGGLVRALSKLSLSYLMHPFRPRISLSERDEIFGFSFWIMLRSVATFLNNKADRLILVAYFSPTILGLYAISGEIATIAVAELLLPIERALFPALATKQHDQEWLERNIIKIFNITATLAITTGVGLASVSEQALTLIYGSQYTQATQMLVLLGIFNAISGINQPVGQFFLLMNKTKLYSLLSMLEALATLTVICVLAINHFDFQTVIYGRFAMLTLAFLRLFYLLKIFKALKFSAIISAWIRPITAGTIMFFVVGFFQQKLHHISPEILLFILIFIGGITFCSVLISLWYIMKKPYGIEYEIFYRNKKIANVSGV